MTDIEIIRHELDDIKERLDKLEQQYTWPTNLDSDFNYIKDHPWDESPFQWMNVNWSNDTSLSKRPGNSTWKASYEDLSTSQYGIIHV